MTDDQAQMEERVQKEMNERLLAVTLENNQLREEIAGLKIQALARSGEAKTQTDLEDFTAFFKSKGVPFHDWIESEDELAGLAICDAILKFNDAGEFMGIFNYESGHLIKRIPAPEGE